MYILPIIFYQIYRTKRWNMYKHDFFFIVRARNLKAPGPQFVHYILAVNIELYSNISCM